MLVNGRFSLRQVLHQTPINPNPEALTALEQMSQRGHTRGLGFGLGLAILDFRGPHFPPYLTWAIPFERYVWR